MEHLGNRGLESFVSVVNDQLYALQPEPHQGPQEVSPERLGFRRPNPHARYFTTTAIMSATYTIRPARTAMTNLFRLQGAWLV